MSVVRTNAAAAILGVSPNTLRSWERRFGFPSPRRTSGGHRQFDLVEIEALRQAFEETHNISSAISVARERGEGPASPVRLKGAFSRFEEDKCDRLLEESLAVRSVERTVEEVLLPTLESLEQEGADSPEYGFAWRYASGWLAAALRVAPGAHREHGVLILDASHPRDLDTLHIQALELGLRRYGLRTLTLNFELDPQRIARALRALEPRAMVLAGRRASLDSLGRLVFAARQSGGQVEVLDFRGALPETGASTVRRLGTSAVAACETLVKRIESAPAVSEAPPSISAAS
ncbi:MAG TPA: MerR family transcriptional regulator [Solirubrobacteraceae bacterium]|jgi:DNA-binding transcriptional MerR regulator|nr:MerR family transcriptional regulator [Solirubrobacteraceae bacterium]